MNVRKTFTKLALSLTAFFWASCDDNSSGPNEVPIQGGDDCSADDVKGGCGGMVALYGVAPNFDLSSSSVTSSDSCEQGCDEMISSSSIAAEPASSNSVEDESWVNGYPTKEIDLQDVRARGDSTCADHGGLQSATQYAPHWGSASMNADQSAYLEMREATKELLQSKDAKKFSTSKKSCLENFVNNIDMVAVYGSPMFENSNDIWKYGCKDGAEIMDQEYTRLEKEYQDEYDAAKKESLEKYQKEVDDCDKA